MKKTFIILAISFVATALVDVTLYFRSTELTFITTSIVFLLTPFLFYERIRERAVINSLLVFSFLIAFVFLAYIVNSRAHVTWNFIIIASVFGYAVGMISKIAAGNKRIILLTFALALILTSAFTIVSKIAAYDKAKFIEDINSEQNRS